jgi:hypothetical protein
VGCSRDFKIGAREKAGIAVLGLAALAAPVHKVQADTSDEKGPPTAVAGRRSPVEAKPLSAEVLTNLTLPKENGNAIGRAGAPTDDRTVANPKATSFFEGLLSWFGVAGAVAAMGWYYKQVKTGTTASNLVSASLFLANDAVLFGSALMTPGQGVTTRAVYGIFAGVGIAVLHAVLQQSKKKAELQGQSASGSQSRPSLSKTDWFCIAACSMGLAALAATQVPWVKGLVAKETLVLFGSALGATVNFVAAVPFIFNCLLKPKPGEQTIDAHRGVARAVLAPVAPFALGSFAIATGLATLEEFTLATLVSPVGLLTTNVLLTTSVGIWAYNRLKR